MIFVTVGTTKYQFPRLLESIDHALTDTSNTESLIVQSGATNYHFQYPHTHQLSEVSFPKLLTLLQTCRLAIIHGGASTIFQALKYSSSLPLVVPRQPKFHEHLNDHQLIFARHLSRKYHFPINLDPDKLSHQIQLLLTSPTPNPHHHQLHCSPRLITRLNQFISHLTSN